MSPAEVGIYLPARCDLRPGCWNCKLESFVSDGINVRLQFSILEELQVEVQLIAFCLVFAISNMFSYLLQKLRAFNDYLEMIHVN